MHGARLSGHHNLIHVKVMNTIIIIIVHIVCSFVHISDNCVYIKIG